MNCVWVFEYNKLNKWWYAVKDTKYAIDKLKVVWIPAGHSDWMYHKRYADYVFGRIIHQHLSQQLKRFPAVVAVNAEVPYSYCNLYQMPKTPGYVYDT